MEDQMRLHGNRRKELCYNGIVQLRLSDAPWGGPLDAERHPEVEENGDCRIK
jgi:hypothetical protein